MKRTLEVLAFACVLAGGAVLGHPAPARAMVAPRPFQGLLSCCKSLDGSKSCCFWTGCMVSATGCFELR